MRHSILNLDSEEFRKLGHDLVDQISDFLEELPTLPVASGKRPGELQKFLQPSEIPENGIDPTHLIDRTTKLLVKNSTFNGHPKFWGYITSSPTPIGILGDFLASAINPNVGGFTLSPIASEIESQTIRWIAQMIGYNEDCGGILVSGGNMANFVGFLAGRKAKADWDIRTEGLRSKNARDMVFYTSDKTHTWIQKASDLFGYGNNAVRWIESDDKNKMRVEILERTIKDDLENNLKPVMVIGTAGTVGTGAIDPLNEIAEICSKYDLWYHVDGAYGAFAAVVPEFSKQMEGMLKADSIALDPHKWLYSPLEAGCTLVKDEKYLLEAFSYHPDYYKFEEDEDSGINYYEYGFQNSRGFRALKVWLGILQAGRSGYQTMISDDIKLAESLAEMIERHDELELFTNSLSITTFRFVPEGHKGNDEYLNQLNEKLLDIIQKEGNVFISNAVINDKFVLRSCIVNFRTELSDLEDLIQIVVDTGRRLTST